MEKIAYGLAGLAIGLGFFLIYVIREKREMRALEIDCAKKSTLNDELKKRLEAQSDDDQKHMHDRFENLANQILDQKSEKITQSNKESMMNLLRPLDRDIQVFRKKVEDIYEKDLTQHASLKEYLEHLQRSQIQLSEDAKNLTTALKGDSKKQGDWGEIMLERILEASGLEKGEEFLMQQNFEGKRPDAIVRLPEDRAIVVDAKVSLKAYERYVSAENDALMNQAIREHIRSVKAHVNALSQKDYSAIKEINTPEFVLLFVPIEAAFVLAMKEDDDLFRYASEKRIVIVTSSTLMATLKTVASLWKLEKQNKHAYEIADRAGRLYDKFMGFLSNIEEMGKAIDKAADAHEKAVKQLSEGSGNIIGRVEKLKEMGIRTNKELPPSFKKLR